MKVLLCAALCIAMSGAVYAEGTTTSASVPVAGATTASNNGAAGEKLITLDLDGVSLDVALMSMLCDRGISGNVSSSANGPVSLHVKDATVEDAFKALAAQNGLSYTLKDKRYNIWKDSKSASPASTTSAYVPVAGATATSNNGATSGKLITLDLDGVSFDGAMSLILRDTGMGWRVDRGFGAKLNKVDLHVKDATVEQALTALTAPLGFTYVKKDGAYRIINGGATVTPESSVTGTTSRSSGSTGNPLVTIDLESADPIDAVDILFRGTGLNYVIDRRNIQSQSDTQVNVHMKNAPFEQALKTIMNAGGLTYRKNADLYVISKAADQTAGRPSDKEEDDAVTTKLGSMSIRDATLSIDQQYAFENELGNIAMPGVSFYQFPRDMAGALMLIAAGLVPPTGEDFTVQKEGKASLADLFQWIPPAGQSTVSGYGGSSYYGGSGSGSGGFGGSFGSPAQTAKLPIAIGGYKSKSGEWLYTVLASQARDIDILQMLFAVSGKSYVMGDITSRPYEATMVVTDPTTKKPTVQKYQQMRGPSLLSVQIYDATLEQALKNITSAAGVQYRITNSNGSTTYIIEAKPANEVSVSIKTPAKGVTLTGEYKNKAGSAPAPSAPPSASGGGGFGGGGYGGSSTGGRVGF